MPDFERLLRAAFSQRRKTLLNSFTSSFSRPVVEDALTTLGRDLKTRAEALGMADFLDLYRALTGRGAEARRARRVVSFPPSEAWETLENLERTASRAAPGRDLPRQGARDRRRRVRRPGGDLRRQPRELLAHRPELPAPGLRRRADPQLDRRLRRRDRRRRIRPARRDLPADSAAPRRRRLAPPAPEGAADGGRPGRRRGAHAGEPAGAAAAAAAVAGLARRDDRFRRRPRCRAVERARAADELRRRARPPAGAVHRRRRAARADEPRRSAQPLAAALRRRARSVAPGACPACRAQGEGALAQSGRGQAPAAGRRGEAGAARQARRRRGGEAAGCRAAGPRKPRRCRREAGSTCRCAVRPISERPADRPVTVRRVSAPSAAGAAARLRRPACLPPAAAAAAEGPARREKQKEFGFVETQTESELPPLNLLQLENEKPTIDEDELVRLGEAIRSRCHEFGVEGTIEGIGPGTGDHGVRVPAGAGGEGQPDREPAGRPRARPQGRVGAHRPHPGPLDAGRRGAESAPRDDPARRRCSPTTPSAGRPRCCRSPSA